MPRQSRTQIRGTGMKTLWNHIENNVVSGIWRLVADRVVPNKGIAWMWGRGKLPSATASRQVKVAVKCSIGVLKSQCSCPKKVVAVKAVSSLQTMQGRLVADVARCPRNVRHCRGVAFIDSCVHLLFRLWVFVCVVIFPLIIFQLHCAAMDRVSDGCVLPPFRLAAKAVSYGQTGRLGMPNGPSRGAEWL